MAALEGRGERRPGPAGVCCACWDWMYVRSTSWESRALAVLDLWRTGDGRSGVSMLCSPLGGQASSTGDAAVCLQIR